ncbi:unnamed protein product, partial [Callosobruchus maculatus]
METVLKQQTPKNLQTDAGIEFFNQNFKNLMKQYNINHYNVFSEKKAAIVERVNRTMKNMVWKEFSLQDLEEKIKVGDHVRISKVRGI